MSAVASLYGSPKASMMSRDPDGTTARDTDESIGLEPSGSRVEDSMDVRLSTSNAENEDLFVWKNNASPSKLASLVGAPPPPPPSGPPPKKNRRRTPKASSVEIKTIQPAEVDFSSFDDDSLMRDLAQSSSSMSSPKVTYTKESPSILLDGGEGTNHSLRTENTYDSFNIDVPPPEEKVGMKNDSSISPATKIVEERVKAAMALYEREDLVLDDDIKVTSQDVLSPKSTNGMPSLSSNPPARNVRDNSSIQPLKHSQDRTNESEPESSILERTKMNSSSSIMKPQPEVRLNKIQQSSSISSASQKREKKKGFFKKLFRGRKPSKGEADVTTQPAQAFAAPFDVSQDDAKIGSPKMIEVEASEPFVVGDQKEHISSVVDDEASVDVDANESHEMNSRIERDISNESVDIGTDDKELTSSDLAFTQDPPDDGHGDPPEYSGRPIGSPISHVGKEELFHERTSRLEPDKSPPNQIYKTQKNKWEANEIGAGGNSSVIHEVENTAEKNDTDRTNPDDSILDEKFSSTFVSLHAAPLEVGDHLANLDPVGASPMYWKSTGRQQMMQGFRDPIGESPVHAWQKEEEDSSNTVVDDPPLTTDFGEESPDASEREEEVSEVLISNSHSSLSETPFERDFLHNNSIEDRSDTKNDDVDKVLENQSDTSSETKKKETSSTTITLSVDSDHFLTRKLRDDEVEDIEVQGFKSKASTPVAGVQKSLTITTAAFTNAKAIAYLHRLNGDPSPRHTWHTSRRKKTDQSSLAIKAKSRKSSKKQQSRILSSGKKPSPSDYGAHNTHEALLAKDDSVTSKPPVHMEELHAIKTREGALFGAYNSKFHGRKPTKQASLSRSQLSTPKGGRLSLGSKGRHNLHSDALKRSFPSYSQLKPGKITASAVVKGMRLRRRKRDDDIASGKSSRVLVTPKPRSEGRNRFTFFPQNETEIKDPIQRAGRRILSKSAIPIQCAARRYIAKRDAVDRMWALIEIQSYYRRWRAETNLQASIHSSILVQRVFRGWLARHQLNDMNASATQVQRIVRGYLCQVKVYDTMYYIVRLQALVRGVAQRTMDSRKEAAITLLQRYLRGYKVRRNLFNTKRVIPLQALYRGHKARQSFIVAVASARLLQATWRSYAARISYQIEIVDIIIVQSIARRFIACRRAVSLRCLELFGPASILQAAWRGRTDRIEFKKMVAARKVQTSWRGFVERQAYKKTLAAKRIQAIWRAFVARKKFKGMLAAIKIQTVWRGFRCYTDYIFSLVDILVAQRTARVWLAKRKANTIRQENATTTIQCYWRRHRAQSVLLYSLVHIIIAQSIVRRFLTQKKVMVLKKNSQKKRDAAVAIQKTWRGFWKFSHYIIVQYEIARLQAVVRGKLARQSFNLKLGCAIIIQATIRRHLAKSAISKKMILNAKWESQMVEFRERSAARKVQFWWRIVLDWTREKKAALTIERFFIHVRAEVDREIMRRERKKMLKKDRRRNRRESDEKMLENAWLNTVDENTTYSRDSRSQSAPRLRIEARTPNNQLLSPKLSSIGQEVDIHGWPLQKPSIKTPRSQVPADLVHMAVSEDASEVSNLTNPTLYNQRHHGRHDAGRPRSSRRMSTDDYIKKYGNSEGVQTVPNRTLDNEPKHFFSDNGSLNSGNLERAMKVGQPVILPPTPRSFSGTPTSAYRSSNTPRSHTSGHEGRRKSSSSSATTRQMIGQSNGGTPNLLHQVPSPRLHVGLPPSTPRSQKGGHKIYASRTGETESQMTFSQNSFTKSSPRPSRNFRYGPPESRTDNGLLYLGGEELGDEYGEV